MATIRQQPGPFDAEKELDQYAGTYRERGVCVDDPQIVLEAEL